MDREKAKEREGEYAYTVCVCVCVCVCVSQVAFKVTVLAEGEVRHIKRESPTGWAFLHSLFVSALGSLLARP